MNKKNIYINKKENLIQLDPKNNYNLKLKQQDKKLENNYC